jgi:hypothetical protein
MTTSYPLPAARTSQRFAWAAARPVLQKRAPGLSPAPLSGTPEGGAMKQFLTALMRSLAPWPA